MLHNTSHEHKQQSIAILAQVATVSQTIRCDSKFTRVEEVGRPRVALLVM